MKRALSALLGRRPRRIRAHETVTSLYVGDNRILTRITVAGEPLLFHVDADDRLITPGFVTTGRYDDDATDFLLETLRPDSRCIDAGANFGYFACLMARLCPAGRVIAIEADPRLAALAANNLLMNGLHGVAAVCAAAANASGEPVRLFRRITRSGNTAMFRPDAAFTDAMGEPEVEDFTAPGVTVDALFDSLGGRLDFLKIDVEGAEPLVIEGARRAIVANPALRVLMEWSPDQIRLAGFDTGDFLRTLGAMGLRAHVRERRRLMPVSWDDVAAMPYHAGLVIARAGTALP